MPKKRTESRPTGLETQSPEEVAMALAESVQFEKILSHARARPTPLVTAKSIRDGEKFMAKMRRGSRAAMLSRIRRGELIAQDELLLRLEGNRRWLTAAIKANRVFSIRTQLEVDYFPAFFADTLERRRDLGKVAKLLADLPGPSRYHFFVSKSSVLGMSPLEALADGRLREVLNRAIGFAES